MRLSYLVAALAVGAGQGEAFGAATLPCFQPSPLASELRMRCVWASAPRAMAVLPKTLLLPTRSAGSCFRPPEFCCRTESHDSRLRLSMSGTARRRRLGSATAVDAAPTGPVGKLTALCLATVRWVLALLRDIYGQFFVLVMDTVIQKPFLFILNKVEIEGHKRLTDLIGRRPRKTPLITVSNHCSSLDEPLLFSALVSSLPGRWWDARGCRVECEDVIVIKL